MSYLLKRKARVYAEGYCDRRYQLILREEGCRLRAFSVKTGKSVQPGELVDGEIDIGIGFHLGRSDALSIFVRVLHLGPDAFETICSGAAAITMQQVRALFDETAEESEDIIDWRLPDVQLAEHERLALVSLAFCSGGSLIGPKITAALKAGDRSAALAEILWNSHANRSPTYRREMDAGVFRRRYREALLFAGCPCNARTEREGDGPVPPYAEYLARHREKHAR